MRSAAIAIHLCLLCLAVAIPPNLSPFLAAFPHDASYTNSTELGSDSFELLKRQSCAANTNSCPSGICCAASNQCTVDAVGNPACCPLGSFCTGTLTYPSAAASTVITSATTVTSGGAIVIIPASTTVLQPTVSATVSTTATVTYIQNPYFPFPIIATSFSNSLACSSAYSACASNYALCTADLQGNNGFAVTINAPGGGVTVAPSVNLGLASATSICSTLAYEACPGNVATCTVWGSGGATGGVTILSAAGRKGRMSAGLLVVLGLVATGWNL